MSGFWKAVGSAGKKIFKGGKQKTSGTEVVNPFKFKASKNKLEKNLRQINVSVHKMKGRMHGDYKKIVAPYVRKWSGKKGDKHSKKKE